MNIYRYGFILCVALLLSACGGGGGGGNGAPAGDGKLTILPASDMPVAAVLTGEAYQKVFSFDARNGTASAIPITTVEVEATGDAGLLAALSLKLTHDGTPIGTTQPVIGGRITFVSLADTLPASATVTYGLEAAVSGNVFWAHNERTKSVRFRITHGNLVPGGTSTTITVVGEAESNSLYREQGRIVFPRGIRIDWNGRGEVSWSPDSNIHIGDMETLATVTITDKVGIKGDGFYIPYFRHGMTPSPSFDRIAFTAIAHNFEPEYGIPFSVKTDGNNFTSHTPQVCLSSGTETTPIYTPDGAFIVYSTTCSHYGPGGVVSWKQDIVAVRTDGSGGFRITDDERQDYSPVVSADGTAVYFLSCHPADNCKVYVVGVNFSEEYSTGTPRVIVGNDWNWTLVDHGAPTILHPGKGEGSRRLSLSPNGEKLLITYKKNNGPDQMGIYDLAGNTMTEVGQGRGAYWAQDGRIVFFKPWWSEEEDFFTPWSESDMPVPLYFMESDGSEVRKVPMEVCFRINWYSCAFGLPLLPAL